VRSRIPGARSILIDPQECGFAAAALPVRLIGLDFDGVMTDNMVYVFEDGREAVRCSRFEGYGLRRAIKAGAEPVILSTEKNPIVSARARKLEIACLQNVENKVEAFGRLLNERGLNWREGAFIGNDVNDLELLCKVGLPAMVADAHEDLDGYGFFQTKRLGGNGAVREFCDAIAQVKEDNPA
jgi:3-deoxy-D-manno-octulosonate 8-phosphate phosphatase (KDO 8-P phosphatase)